ncbi:hypothetical protein D3C78_788930 [compost metagenome]
MIDGVEATLLHGGQLAPARTGGKALQALAHRLGRDVLTDLHRLCAAHALVARHQDHLGFARQQLLRVYGAPAFDEGGRDVVTAGQQGHGAPHVLAIGVAVLGRTLVTQLDVDPGRLALRLGNPGSDGVNLGLVFVGHLLGTGLLAGHLAKQQGARHVAGQGLGVVVHHHHRNASLLEARQIRGQGLVLPLGQDHQIGFDRQGLLDGEALILHVAKVGHLGQLRQAGHIEGPDGGAGLDEPATGHAHQAIGAPFTGHGQVILGIETEHYAARRQAQGDLAAHHIFHFNGGGGLRHPAHQGELTKQQQLCQGVTKHLVAPRE